MATIPWDQRVARVLVRPLAHTPITPNQLTILTIVLALAAAYLFSTAVASLAHWAAGLFVLARFLDHFDGELARLTGRTSRLGYYLDYIAGAVSYAGLFLGIGIGLSHGPLGVWAPVLGGAGALSALLAMPVNMGIDTAGADDSAVGYPAWGGFELEDGIYLIAPITWLGYLSEFFVAAGVGAVLYLVWATACWLRTKKT